MLHLWVATSREILMRWANAGRRELSYLVVTQDYAASLCFVRMLAPMALELRSLVWRRQIIKPIQTKQSTATEEDLRSTLFVEYYERSLIPVVLRVGISTLPTVPCHIFVCTATFPFKRTLPFFMNLVRAVLLVCCHNYCVAERS